MNRRPRTLLILFPARAPLPLPSIRLLCIGCRANGLGARAKKHLFERLAHAELACAVRSLWRFLGGTRGGGGEGLLVGVVLELHGRHALSQLLIRQFEPSNLALEHETLLLFLCVDDSGVDQLLQDLVMLLFELCIDPIPVELLLRGLGRAQVCHALLQLPHPLPQRLELFVLGVEVCLKRCHLPRCYRQLSLSNVRQGRLPLVHLSAVECGGGCAQLSLQLPHLPLQRLCVRALSTLLLLLSLLFFFLLLL
mmetsp:Transcript_26024/g.61701  ORF Transcript_26024/g.61701 Transcript_26024/m.61701 type:complete len:252 (+) Transcript_26024:229-984(+)